MSQNLVAEFLLKLNDQISAPLLAVTDTLDRLGRVAQTIKMPGLSAAADQAAGLNTKLGETNGLLGRMKTLAAEAGEAMRTMGGMAGGGLARAGEEARALPGRLKKFGEAGGNLMGAGFGAAAEGFAVYEPIAKYAERDKLLRSIGIMEGKSGTALDAEIARLNTLVNADALKNGLSSEGVAEAYKDLLGQGLPRAAIDGIIGAHSEAAKAYGIPPEILGAVTGSIVGNLKIPSNERDAGGALAAIAAASQGGRFKMADFSRELPGLTGVAASLGMTGRGSLNELAAALEISTKTASDPTQAGVNMHDLLAYITSNREDNLTRKKLRIDLPALLLRGEKEGRNPLDVFLAEIKKITAGKSPVAQAQAISSIVTNQQARNALLALVQHNGEFEALRQKLAAINAEKLKLDHDSAMQGPQTSLDRLNEVVGQLTRTLGAGFAPVLGPIVSGLDKLNKGLTWLNTNFPNATAGVLTGVASLLALAAVITLLGAVVPVFTTGFGVFAGVFRIALFSVSGFFNAFKYGLFVLEYFTGITAGVAGAIAVVAAVLALAAIDIYENWDRFKGFFAGMWSGVREVFWGFVDFLHGVFTLNMGEAAGGAERAWGGLKQFFVNLWAAIKQLFVDFGSWVDGWTNGIASKIAGGVASGLENAVNTSANWVRTHVGLSPLAMPGGSPLAAGAGAPGANGSVTVHVTADPGVQARATSTTGNVKVQTPDRGATVTRP